MGPVQFQSMFKSSCVALLFLKKKKEGKKNTEVKDRSLYLVFFAEHCGLFWIFARTKCCFIHFNPIAGNDTAGLPPPWSPVDCLFSSRSLVFPHLTRLYICFVISSCDQVKVIYVCGGHTFSNKRLSAVKTRARGSLINITMLKAWQDQIIKFLGML